MNNIVIASTCLWNVSLLANNPVSGKACSLTKGGLICLYMQPLLVPQTTEFVICIPIYILLHAVTLLPPPRSLVPRLGLGTTWVRQLRSGSCHYPAAATKCNVCLLANNPVSGKACSPTKGGLICLYMQPLLVPQTTEFVICISIYILLHAVTFAPMKQLLLWSGEKHKSRKFPQSISLW